MLNHSVTPFPTLRHMADSQLQESIELIGKALGLVRQTLNHEAPVPYAAWPHRLRYDCEKAAQAALNRLEPDQCRQARLRARESVALELYGNREFARLTQHEQNSIIQHVSVICKTYELAMEGTINGLPKGNPRRADLEPEVAQGRAS